MKKEDAPNHSIQLRPYRNKPSILIVRCAGNWDVERNGVSLPSLITDFESQFNQLETSSFTSLILDLRRVTFLGAAGINTLLRIYATLRKIRVLKTVLITSKTAQGERLRANLVQHHFQACCNGSYFSTLEEGIKTLALEETNGSRY